MNEYCPKCGQPLQPSDEPDRLCDVCAWFGDKSEALSEEPNGAGIVRGMLDVFRLYRSICRDELAIEGQGTVADVAKVKRYIHETQQAIVQMFLGVRKP